MLFQVTLISGKEIPGSWITLFVQYANVTWCCNTQGRSVCGLVGSAGTSLCPGMALLAGRGSSGTLYFPHPPVSIFTKGTRAGLLCTQQCDGKTHHHFKCVCVSHTLFALLKEASVPDGCDDQLFLPLSKRRIQPWVDTRLSEGSPFRILRSCDVTNSRKFSFLFLLQYAKEFLHYLRLLSLATFLLSKSLQF